MKLFFCILFFVVVVENILLLFINAFTIDVNQWKWIFTDDRIKPASSFKFILLVHKKSVLKSYNHYMSYLLSCVITALANESVSEN